MKGQLTGTWNVSRQQSLWKDRFSFHTWDLVQVDADAVVLRVSVEEHTKLQQRIRTVFDTGDHAAGRECCLLDISVEILGILVQDHAAEVMHLILSVHQLHLFRRFFLGAYGELISGPDFGNIERVKAEYIDVCVRWLHDLDLCVPYNLFSILDGFPEFLLRIIGILARDPDRFWTGELLLSVFGNEMVFDINELALLVDPIIR